MTADDLLTAWRGLPTPSAPDRLEAAPISDLHGVWLAIDHTAARHLLIQVSDGAQIPMTDTRGLTAAVARHRIAGQVDAHYLDISTVESAAADAFGAVANEIIETLATADAEARVDVVRQVIGKWRWFWGISADALSERSALGLFAELWFLDQWAGVTPTAVDAWTGAGNARHDFQWTERSVEVKATARRTDGTTIHTIQHLDQLAPPEVGSLHLYSMRVVRDRLAANSLPSQVDRCADQLRGHPQARDAFLRKVAGRGYSPAHRHIHTTSYRLLEEGLYDVGPDFPRLTTDSFDRGLPAGITDVSYKLDMAACEPWLRTRRPKDWTSPTGGGG